MTGSEHGMSFDAFGGRAFALLRSGESGQVFVES